MNTRALFKPVKVFVFDVDGVLTNGTLLVTEEGHLLRTMNIKDGYALQLAIKKGYQIWIISGGTSNAVVKRLSKLGLEGGEGCVREVIENVLKLNNHWE